MFFIISKITAFLLSPLTLICVLFLCGIVARSGKHSRRYFITAFVFFMFFTNAAFIDELIRSWEEPMITLDKGQHYDAGIVLGGGMVDIDNNNDRLIFRDNTDRILQAILLYQQGVVKKVIVSGGPGSLVFNDVIEAKLIKRYWLDIGLPESDIIIDSTSHNTHENAVNCVHIINKTCQQTHILLITSALHMKRATACFNNEGQCVTMYSVGQIAGKRRTDIGYYLIPETEAITRWENYIHEVLGYLMYAMMGYI